MYRRCLFISALLALVMAMGLQSAGTATAANASITAGGAADRFFPNTANVNVGDTVTFNWGASAHTATSVTGAFNFPLDAAHTTGTFTPTAAGTYYFYCAIHASAALATEAHVQANDAMVGKIVVSAAGTATATSTATSSATPTATTTGTTATATPTRTPTTVPSTPTTAPTTAVPSGPTITSGSINLVLTGANEVPPVNTNATATFIGQVSGNTLQFRLRAQGNGQLLTMAHIHLGAPGVNGPIVAFLFGPNMAGVPSFDVGGTITQASLIGPLAGDIAGFFAALNAGNLYVNVHSIDFPNGVARAQIPGAPAAPATGSGTGFDAGTAVLPAVAIAFAFTLSALALAASLRRRRSDD